MNRFVKTALAVAVVGSATHAGTGDNDWTALDSEISGLASSLKPSQDGVGWSALIRAVYSYSSDDISTGRSEPDTSGFNLKDVDLAFWGASGPYSWRVSADLDGNGFEFDNGTGGPSVTSSSSQIWLEDAYVRWNCGGQFDTTMGNFKPRVTRSNSVDPEKQLFINRTVLGSAFDTWDMGVGAAGSYDMVHWSAALMNGLNGHERDHFYVLRGEFDIGSGAGNYEGAMGSSDTLNATIGLSFVGNDTNDGLSLDIDGDGTSDVTGGGPGDHVRNWILDFNGSVSNVGLGFEVAELDDDFLATTDEDFGNIFDSSSAPMGQAFPFLAFGGNSNPWSATVSYLITSEWEVAARYEDLDNGSSGGPDNTVLSLGANWYRQGGKWQAQWTSINADSAYNEGNYLEVGYSIGSTR